MRLFKSKFGSSAGIGQFCINLKSLGILKWRARDRSGRAVFGWESRAETSIAMRSPKPNHQISVIK